MASPKGIAAIEHVNISVSDPQRSAAFLQQLCGWHIRWEGAAMNNGYTIHVGSETGYLAIYTNDDIKAALSKGKFAKSAPLNHVGLQVDDLAKARGIVLDARLEPFSDSDYDPGPRSFYFFDWDGIEFEVVSYE
ncbi:VOC family protein [Pontixanthobacter aquaemixtae]|uniref:VOC family protein n=1 Tax=Pontixanthobacter aquaemixtae TaxID=1958940 RepID=A0A844ZN06_9SPHN|nr:VOC family protein [Pontixanthobacter aquaemixtae]MXO89761.1 VOC family protein [Pontixanthobacter aquaemixtae]